MKNRCIWVAAPRSSNEDIEKEIERFVSGGGEVTYLESNHKRIAAKKAARAAKKAGNPFRKIGGWFNPLIKAESLG